MKAHQTRCITWCLAFVLIAQVSAQSAAWDKWGVWSNCTRPCGGGVTQRSRQCIGESDGLSCEGKSVEYSMCNIQDCPDGTPNFRMKQCSAYDNKPFKGKIFRWASFTHGAGECELKCMPKKHFFYVTFKDKVIDGTRCNPYTLDVCINGTCQPVGCDNQLFSDAKFDECGVCRGDGSTCVQLKDTYKPIEGAYGYVKVTKIAEGATSVYIKENGDPDMYLALTTSSGKNVLNGDYIFTSPRKMKLHGNIMHYERNAQVNQITIDGPTEVPLQLKVFVMEGSEQQNNISFQYMLPKADAPIEQPKRAEYVYVENEWTECTKSCATGFRSRSYFCANRVTKEKVEAFYCNNLQRPVTRERCNTQSCPARWYISQWAACSTTCGRGLRARRVHCVRTQPDGNIEMLSLEKCPGETPRRVEVCVDQGSCPKWFANEWSQCSQSCGNGVQTRQVECMSMEDNSVEATKCSEAEKPIIQQPCHNAPCGSLWKTGPWRECSAECGRGMRMRQVTCENSEGFEVPASFCDKENEPKHYEECTAEEGECKPRWQTTMWSKCSSKCGRGMQYRSSYCTLLNPELNRMSVLKNTECPSDEQPIVVRRCKNEKPCRVRYFVSRWSKCSVSCGTGIAKRTIQCYADRNIDYSKHACAKLQEPISFKLCDMPKCDGSDEITTPLSQTTTPVPSTTKTVSLKGPVILHKGDNADYTCTVTGLRNPKITWYSDDKPLMSNSRLRPVDARFGSKLIVLSASEEDGGRLKCYAEDGNQKGEDSLDVLVYVKPTTKLSQTSTNVKAGQSLTITCQVEGFPKPRVQWQKNDDVFRVDGLRITRTDSAITFKRLVTSDSGKYDCIAFNAAGSSTSTANLKVAADENANESISTGEESSTSTDDNNCQDQQNTCNLAKQMKLCEFPHYEKRVCCKTCRKLANEVIKKSR
eukprot:TCONS_00055972-protein